MVARAIITGVPYRQPTSIRLVDVHPGDRELATYDLEQRLIRNAPRDTGALAASPRRIPGGLVTLGPLRNPRTGSRFYALPANRRSRRPGYIDRSIRDTQSDLRVLERQRRQTALVFASVPWQLTRRGQQVLANDFVRELEEAVRLDAVRRVGLYQSAGR